MVLITEGTAVYLNNLAKTPMVEGEVIPILGTYVEPIPPVESSEHSFTFCG